MHSNPLGPITRICSQCGLPKPDSMFYRHISIKPDGIRKKCDDCRNLYRKQAHLENPLIKQRQSNTWASKNRAKIAAAARTKRAQNPRRFKGYSLKKDFGITIETYDAMKVTQNNLCAICGKPETSTHNNGKIKELAVDHCHSTGKIRGLLCWVCNTGIGKLLHSPDLLRKAAAYIEAAK